MSTSPRPLRSRARIAVDETGRSVPAGVEGEVEAVGPQLCVGYLDPAMNAAFRNFARFGGALVMVRAARRRPHPEARAA